MIHYGNVASACKVNKHTDKEAVRRGRWVGSLVKERDLLLRKNNLSLDDEIRLDLIENTILQSR